MTNWISIKDQLPKENDVVDIYIKDYDERWTGYNYIKEHEGQKDNSFFQPIKSGLCYVRNATHWMYVPESPKD